MNHPFRANRPRRRVAAAALATVAASLTVAVAGCGGGDDSTTSAAAAVAGYVPAGSPVYFEVSTDTDGPQWQQIVGLAKKFPGYPDLEAQIQQGLSEGSINYQNDVKPVLGDRAGFGVLPNAGASGADALEDPGFVGAVDLADGKDADAVALLEKGGATRMGERQGIAYYGDPDDDGLAAVTENTLVLGDTVDNLFAGIDASKQGGDKVISGTAKFTDTMGKLPDDTFAEAYVDLGALVGAASQSSPELGQLGGAGQVKDSALGASVAAEPEGVRVKGVLTGLPEGQTGEPFSPALLQKAPADSLAYLGFANLTGYVENALSSLGESGGDTRQQLEGFAGQFQQATGVSLDELADLGRGEHAVVVTQGSPIPGVAVLLGQADGTRAEATLDKLRVALPRVLASIDPSTTLPPWRPVPLANGVSGWQLPLDANDGVGVVYGVDGDLAILGSTPATVKTLQQPPAPLADAPDFTAGTEGMPDEVTSLLWVNLSEGIDALDNAGAFDDADPGTVENLRPLKSLAAWSTGGDAPTFEFFLRIAE